VYHTEAGAVYHTKRRGRVWYYRRRVPRQLVPIVGRVEVQKSLRTADHREAKRRAVVVELGLGRRWAALLGQRERAVRLEQNEVDRLAEEYYDRLVAEDRAGRHTWRPQGRTIPGMPDWVDPDEVEFQDHVFYGYWSVLQDEEERMRGDRRSVKEDVEQVASGREFDEETRERLAYAFQRERMRFLREMAKEWEDDFAGKPRAPLVASGATGLTVNTPGSASSAKRITEAVREWMHAEGAKWAMKTQNEAKRDLARLVQVVGDVPLDKVKREDVKRFKAVLERVPRGTPATADITTFAAAELPEQRLDRATVTKSLGSVSRFFAWTVDLEWIEKSPAAGVLKGKKRGREAQELRESFTRGELEGIFGADFAQWERERPARFWVPVLLLYTGARLDEVAQLLVEDVHEVDGVLVLDFNENGERKSLKTAASRRKVPVHSQLVELGFTEFVESRQRDRAKRLFPDVKYSSANGWGDAVGKWFTHWRRAHGVTSGKKTLHSTRHTVRDGLSRAKVQAHVVNAVQGWENEGTAFGQYGSAPGLDELREAVERLDWSGPLAALFKRKRG
jgi:integrase